MTPRLWLVLALLLASAAPAAGAAVVVQTVSIGTVTSDETATFSASVTSGNAVICGWSSQDSVDTHSARLVGRFELLGTDTAEMTVAARSIVEGIDIVGHVG